jgi:hypothetical protein
MALVLLSRHAEAEKQMENNISQSERMPRIVMAIGMGAVAALASNRLFRTVFLGGATALLATVATGYCPLNAMRESDEAPHWRTLKTYRVQA